MFSFKNEVVGFITIMRDSMSNCEGKKCKWQRKLQSYKAEVGVSNDEKNYSSNII